MYKFGQLWSSNVGDYEGNTCTFLDETEKSAYLTKHLSDYSTNLLQSCSIGRDIYGIGIIQEGLAVASIVRDVGSSSTNRPIFYQDY